MYGHRLLTYFVYGMVTLADAERPHAAVWFILYSTVLDALNDNV